MNFLISGVGVMAACLGLAARADPVLPHICYSTSESRDKIDAQGLVDPLKLMRGAAGLAGAEPVGVKLCLWSEDLVYEMSLLRRDGHVNRVFINARTGEIVGSRTRIPAR